ncbi:MAG: NUDIX hydrolase [Bifidobacteriaceae bacterium]|nr:NUDIX hydrolase [Bifidobacteriaceae bacterium]
MGAAEDNWLDCRCGQRHWGVFGAAGLLVWHRGNVLLQLRADRSHHGGTWALPGGARRRGESPLATALREGREEAGLRADRLSPAWRVIADHTGWAYTTIGAEAGADPLEGPANWETARLEWVEVEAVAGFDLHPGLRQVWPTLRDLVGKRATLVVDAANVVGSTPDGWWRDRAGAARRLLAELEPVARRGLANTGDGPPNAWYPKLVLVVEGQARGIGPGEGVDVVEAPGGGDDQIVTEARRAVAAGAGPVEVATADKALIARLRLVGAGVMRPGTLLQAIR